MVKKGTPARVEPAGSFLPVVPEEGQEEPSEAAGSAAANPTATSQVEGSEAAGSAAARPPRGREGRGRAGKSVNRKEDRKVYYEAQDLYRQYWGVRQTPRIKYGTRLGSTAQSCWTSTIGTTLVALTQQRRSLTRRCQLGPNSPRVQALPHQLKLLQTGWWKLDRKFWSQALHQLWCSPHASQKAHRLGLSRAQHRSQGGRPRRLFVTVGVGLRLHQQLIGLLAVPHHRKHQEHRQ